MSTHNVKSIALKAGGAYLVCVLVFCLGLAVAGLASDAPTKSNLSSSLTTLHKQGQYYKVFDNRGWQVDNFTNALMLNMAGCDLGIEGAFGGYYYTDGDNQIDSLSSSLQSIPSLDNDSYQAYARYWNGWLLPLRFLLMFFDLSQIQVMLFVGLTCLLVGAALSVHRIAGATPALALATAYAAAAYPIACFSLSFFSCFAISLLACCAVAIDARRRNEGRHPIVTSWPFAAFLLGAITVYFDFLCNPVLTLGIPLALAVHLGSFNDAQDFGRLLLQVFVICMAWAIGYAALWVTKWVISSAIMHQDVVMQGISQFLYRSGELPPGKTAEEFSRLATLNRNFSFMFPSWALKLLAICSAICICYLAIRRNQLRSTDWRVIVAILAIAIIPYAWYLAAANHSFIHCWFTWRNQAITVFALLLVACRLVDTTRERRSSIPKPAPTIPHESDAMQ